MMQIKHAVSEDHSVNYTTYIYILLIIIHLAFLYFFIKVLGTSSLNSMSKGRNL